MSNKLVPGVNLIATITEYDGIRLVFLLSCHLIACLFRLLSGEISCSMEETNRIRAMLGMKPLKMKTNGDIYEKEAAVKSYEEQLKNEKRKRAVEEVRGRLGEAKERRIDKAKLTGAGLAEFNVEEDTNLLSTADWVKRSRSKPLNEAKTLKISTEVQQVLRSRHEEGR